MERTKRATFLMFENCVEMQNGESKEKIDRIESRDIAQTEIGKFNIASAGNETLHLEIRTLQSDTRKHFSDTEKKTEIPSLII